MVLGVVLRMDKRVYSGGQMAKLAQMTYMQDISLQTHYFIAFQIILNIFVFIFDKIAKFRH